MNPSLAPPDLPPDLEWERELARSPRSSVHLVRRSGERHVLRLGEHACALDGEVAPFSRLRHPGLVPPIEWGRTEQGTPYVLRPYVDGRPFAQARHGATGAELVARVHSLLETLAALHDGGLVHRDVKSDNVIVGAEGVFLIDLEFAEELRADQGGFGSHYHIAPEVMMGQPHRPCADLFSLGAMIAYACCGDPSDSFHARFPGTDFWKASGLDPEDLPADLRPLVRALVRRHPADRPASARLAMVLLPEHHSDIAIPVQIPFLLGREQALDPLTDGAPDPNPLWVVSVEDPEELGPLSAEIQLRLGAGGRPVYAEQLEHGADPVLDGLGAVPDPELFTWPPGSTLIAHGDPDPAAALGLLREALLGGERGIVLLLPPVSARRLIRAFESELIGDERARYRTLAFPPVTREGLTEHLQRLSGGASPRVARSLASSLQLQTRGSRSLINRRLEAAEADGVLRPMDSHYALLLEEWPAQSGAPLDASGRLQALSPEARVLLAATAVLGRHATPAALLAVCGLEREVADRQLGELYDGSFLAPGLGVDGQVLEAEAGLLGDAANSIGAEPLEALHGRASAWLEQRGASDFELALHRVRSSRSGDVLQAALEVAERERLAGRLGRARMLAREVGLRAGADTRAAGLSAAVLQARLELGQGRAEEALCSLNPILSGAPESVTPELLLVAAEASELAGERAQARRFYERVGELPTGAEEKLRTAVGLAYGLYLDGDPAAALVRIEGLPREQDADEPAGALLNLRAGALAQLGRYGEAGEALDAAMERAQACQDPTLVGRTELNRAFVERRQGFPLAALQSLERARAAFAGSDNVKLRALAANNMAVLLRDLGRLAEAQTLHEETLDLRRRIGDMHGAAVSMGNLGIIALDRAQVGASLPWFERARVRMDRGGYGRERTLVQAHHAQALGLLGDTEGAEAILGETELDWLRRARPLLLHRTEALLLLARNGSAEATELLRSKLEELPGDTEVAEIFRTAASLIALDPSSELAKGHLSKAAGRLQSTTRELEASWLTRDRQDHPGADRMRSWLGGFERAGRTDLVFAVAMRRAQLLDQAGRLEERRQVAARAQQATDALMDGVPEPARTGTLERLAILAGADSRTISAQDTRVGLEWFIEWNRRMARDQDLEGLLYATIDMALESTRASGGFLVLMDGEDIDVQVARNMDHETMPEDQVRLSSTVVREAIQSGSSVISTNVASDPRFSRAESIKLMEPVSILCVPISPASGARGALYLTGSPGQETFDDFDRSTLQFLADQAAIAVTDQRRRAEVEDLTRRLREQISYREGEIVRMRSMLWQKGDVPPVGDLVGESPAMRDLSQQIARFAATDLPVLIKGPRGAEISSVARALHEHSNRSSGPYLTQNVAVLPPKLMEEELFGYAKGAFEGAGRNRLGLLSKAHNGTLFLDAIDKLPPDIQVKLLDALETGQFRPVGSRKLRTSQVRLIVSSRSDLESLVRSGSFHSDLFHYTNAVELGIPPLNERPEDVPALARHCLDELNRKHDKHKTISDETLMALAQRPWPGELRELSNEISRLYFLCDRAIDGPGLVRNPESLAAKPDTMPASFRLEDVERAAITRALEATGWNKEQAARALGISRAGLYKKLGRLGIETPKD